MPKIVKKLDKLRDKSAHCFPTYSRGSKFEVRELHMDQFVVDILHKGPVLVENGSRVGSHVHIFVVMEKIQTTMFILVTLEQHS